MDDLIKKVKKKFKYNIITPNSFKKNYVEDFIFSINISRAVITDSFHGTIFSIIFNKSFISYINSRRGRGRFTSLIEIFNLKNRIVFPKKNNLNVDINLLNKPLNINQTLLNLLKKKSIDYLIKNLGLI